jgi:hypothetical protein
MNKETLGSKDEVREEFQKRTDEIKALEKELDIATQDHKTVVQTLHDWQPVGTRDGSEEVKTLIGRAKESAATEFHETDTHLDTAQDHGKEYQTEAEEHSEAVEQYRNKLSEANAAVAARETKGELDHAKTAAEQDAEFLRAQTQEQQRQQEESDRIQEALRAQIRD